MNFVDDAPFRIGQWRIDPALDEISRGETTVKLEPRTMRVLVCLAEHAGDVVSVDYLLNTVWKDLVVTQSSVYQAVAILRRALGDDPKEPIYIANVLRRGYRLIAAVGPDEQAPVTPSSDASSEAHPERPAAEARPAAVADEPQAVPPDAADARPAASPHVNWRAGSLLIALLLLAGGTWRLLSHLGHQHPTAASAQSQTTSSLAETDRTPFTPPHHSLAVLPFTNMSGDPKEEYFSDGMTEELINALTQIDALKVIARTSSFSFKGKDADIGTIARKLNVAAILEGSVRRSGNTVRITAQLIDGVNGFHIWSQDYDRDLTNALTLQTEIATAVAHELRARLLEDETPKMELGGTHNPAAFDAFLRGARAQGTEHGAQDLHTAIAAYTEAIQLDPQYALAFAGRSLALNGYAVEFATGAAVRESFAKAHADARQALALAPELVEGHLAMGRSWENGSLDFAQASEAYERALALAPGNAEVLRENARFATSMGRFEAALAAARRAVVLDPLNASSHYRLGLGLFWSRRYAEAIATFTEAISLDPDHAQAHAYRGLAHYLLNDLQAARTSCENRPDHWITQWCRAIVYEKLGRHADAEAELAKVRATNADVASVQYAEIFAQWGNRTKALESLDTAMRLHDPGLERLKVDPLMDSIRSDPRFQAIERQLKFPN
jgi:TolB-like protein/DNA-binding winged helix-turn-helix (wHTH) protein/Tfp pilus assembly protein PilF